MLFRSYDFDHQKRIDNILNYTIDLDGVRDQKIAVSYDGKQFVIAYKWDQDQGFKVAYMANGKLTMLEDPSHTAENLIAQVAEQARKSAEILQKKINDMSSRPLHEIITKKWTQKVIAANGDMKTAVFDLNCQADGRISGTLESVSTYTKEGPYGAYMSVYSVKYEVSGNVTAKDAFTIRIGNVIHIDEGLQPTEPGTEIPFKILIDINDEKTEVRGLFLQCSYGNFIEQGR